ncbi:LacI family DNA-binding transcriptional regulator [Cohaesibacter haloalkalitolerans]|uniref:LacI family DNA-binding transcriptional regulator n=1 Tax=Cohaesibacter haloalkalitolerans TaxID=1162980 RepID=UPI000E648AB6|nr:LacI family DNA-binding transcriptional regulator [Cohaesibacter haloalkalitolerans]
MAKNRQKVTVSDIAKRAGVSTATVSNTMNGTGRVSEMTRVKVKQAMEELGFVRDYTAAKLRTGRSRLVGVLVQDIANPFYGEFSASFEAALSNEGYLPIIANIGEDKERQSTLLAEVIAHGVAGIIVSPSANTEVDDLERTFAHEIPVVTFVREIENADFDFVGVDDYRCGELAAKQFLRDAHSQFAVIGGLESSSTGRLRVKGFVDTLHKADIPDHSIVVKQGPQSRNFGREAAVELSETEAPFTAVFCHNDIVAMGATAGFLSRGRVIGEDLSLIGCDNLPEANIWNPPLTSVETYSRSVGKIAAELIISRINGDTGKHRTVRLEPKLIERQSTFAFAG